MYGVLGEAHRNWIVLSCGASDSRPRVIVMYLAAAGECSKSREWPGTVAVIGVSWRPVYTPAGLKLAPLRYPCECSASILDVLDFKNPWNNRGVGRHRRVDGIFEGMREGNTEEVVGGAGATETTV